jgi:hypothetical protein
MTLKGKGYYLWQLPYCDGGNPELIAARAKKAGLSHAMIKIADGSTWPYNFDFDRNVDLIPPVASALKAEGIKVWGWHYVRGYDPLNEARLAVKRMTELNLDGYVIDAEGEYRDTSKRAAASRFMKELRLGLPNIPVALSTYRYPKVHQAFPYAEFLDGCDISMPQVYFEQMHNPEEQLERCVEQYMELTPARPVIPTAPTYARGDWRPTADEITRFFAKAQELGLSAANAWSWDFAARPKYMDLFNAVGDYDWPAEPPVADMPERLIGRLNHHDPVFVAGLYKENAAHVTGERTVVGRPYVEQWYRHMFTELLPDATFKVTGKSGSGRTRHFTWEARSSKGAIFDGNDTLGLIDGRIQYHYTYFTMQKSMRSAA